MTIKCKRNYADLDQGHVDYGFTDKQGRKVGYKWTIRMHIHTLITDEDRWGYYILQDDEPLQYMVIDGSPTRDGKRYGSSHNDVKVASLQDAHIQIAKRIGNARARDEKKFRKEVA